MLEILNEINHSYAFKEELEKSNIDDVCHAMQKLIYTIYKQLEPSSKRQFTDFLQCMANHDPKENNLKNKI